MTAPCHHGVPDPETCAWLTFLLTPDGQSGLSVEEPHRHHYRRSSTQTFASSWPLGNSSRSSPGGSYRYELGCPVRNESTRDAKGVPSWNRNPCPASG